MQKKVRVRNLKIGMYVCRFDRDWLESPLWSHGFLIKKSGEIEALQKICKYVYIDTERGCDVEQETQEDVPVNDQASAQPVPRVSKKGVLGIGGVKALAPLEQEITTALPLHQEAQCIIDGLFHDVRMGRGVDSREAAQTIRGMVGSVMRNPNALLCLTQLKDMDEYTSLHSINVCVFSLALGHHAGLDPHQLFELGMGALLHDVGKALVPIDILNKPGRLTDKEFAEMKAHPLYGRDILAESGGVPETVLNVALQHHERYNGAGYPFGLKGEAITPFAQIVAITDAYDAMTSQRVYNRPLSEQDGLRELYAGRGTAFDPGMVTRFIQCIGVYPVGSLVRLSSGEKGMVSATNQVDRTRPVVKLLMSKKGIPYQAPFYIDLNTRRRDDLGCPLFIEQVLNSDDLLLDLETLTVRDSGRALATDSGSNVTAKKRDSAADSAFSSMVLAT